MYKFLKRITFLFILMHYFINVNAQNDVYPKYFDASKEDLVWVDSVWNAFSDNEKIAQLFIVPFYTPKSYNEVSMLVRKYNVGGVIFFKGRAEDQVNAINRLNTVAKTPLIYTLDAEWGLGMRLPKDGISYPYAMTLGAIENDELIYRMAEQISTQLKRVGVKVSYGPVADLNNNPLNPVINYRSFGENKEKVARKSIQYMRGLQDNNVVSVAKHFPGHGDTNVDSHKDLPIIPHSIKRLDSLELYPFSKLIEAGVGGVMSAHLQVPVWDDKTSSLSHKIIQEILRDSLGFNGLIFTDGILMDAITKQYKGYGKADAEALVAGNDVIEFTNHIDKAIKEVKLQIDKGNLSWHQIDEKGYRMLLMKRWVGADKQKRLLLSHLDEDLHPLEAQQLIQEISDEAVTLLENKKQLLPLSTNSGRVAIVNIGADYKELPKGLIAKGVDVKSYFLSKYASESQVIQLTKALQKYDVIVTQVGGLYMSQKVKDIAVELTNHKPTATMKYPYGVTYSTLKYFDITNKWQNQIVVFLGNAYTLRTFKDIENNSGLILTYQNNKALRKSVTKVILGDILPKGTLPVTIDQRFKEGIGLKSFDDHNVQKINSEELNVQEVPKINKQND
ncbi:glycoside hydrolase family 3 protein [Flammeovirga pectinis]|uniref:beta-N-acetylhexosaminidase n=1 Tax=Flammeovirga pectinis TaxID=2494373 RepID=A0A3Q9FQB5_9BACT|nr:glycoside hydrolase family 3 protein [Flammeovirga pectinis]AZQ62334.1 glycoside hydrolase family 3 protein [Flammeovirga pectinis]